MPRRLINTHAAKHTVVGPDIADFVTDTEQPLTARGGPMTLSATPTAVPGASITAPAIDASRNYTITYSVELDIPSGDETEVTLAIFDGIASVGIDTYHQAVGVSGGEGSRQEVVSWTLIVAGNSSTRTFGLAVSDPAAIVTIPANGCRGVVQAH
jgi:hypothetical protein